MHVRRYVQTHRHQVLFRLLAREFAGVVMRKQAPVFSVTSSPKRTDLLATKGHFRYKDPLKSNKIKARLRLVFLWK